MLDLANAARVQPDLLCSFMLFYRDRRSVPDKSRVKVLLSLEVEFKIEALPNKGRIDSTNVAFGKRRWEPIKGSLSH